MQHVLSVKRCFFQILKFRLILWRRRRRPNLLKLLNMNLYEFSKPFVTSYSLGAIYGFSLLR